MGRQNHLVGGGRQQSRVRREILPATPEEQGRQVAVSQREMRDYMISQVRGFERGLEVMVLSIN